MFDVRSRYIAVMNDSVPYCLRPKIKFCLFAIAYLPTKILPTQNIILTTWDSISFPKWQIYYDHPSTNRSEQKVQSSEQSDLGLHCLPFHLHILGTPFV